MRTYPSNNKSKSMKPHADNHENIENQKVNVDGRVDAKEERPTSEMEGCVNMAEVGDTLSAEDPGKVTPPTHEEEAAIWKDKFVRLSAEYENYRKRTFKEKLDLINAGGEDVVRSMLDVLDDMDRALEAITKTDDLESVRQGMMLIYNKLRGVLRGKGLSEIEAMGSELDTDLHEAVARVATEDAALKGKIIDVVQKGYKLKDKIIRYAKVVVGQ